MDVPRGVEGGFEGSIRSRLGGFEASRPRGLEASRLGGFEAWRLPGFQASRFRGLEILFFTAFIVPLSLMCFRLVFKSGGCGQGYNPGYQ